MWRGRGNDVVLRVRRVYLSEDDPCSTHVVQVTASGRLRTEHRTGDHVAVAQVAAAARGTPLSFCASAIRFVQNGPPLPAGLRGGHHGPPDRLARTRELIRACRLRGSRRALLELRRINPTAARLVVFAQTQPGLLFVETTP